MGKIINIDEKDKYNIYHKCSTFHRASGCPIINLNNNRVIGIHKGGDKNDDYNLGTIINLPLKQFYEEKKININKEKNKIQIVATQPKNQNIVEIKDFIKKY